MKDTAKESYLKTLRVELIDLEEAENYEECAELRDYIKDIEADNLEAFLHAEFDLAGMTDLGFFEVGMTTSKRVERVKQFFGFTSIFEYKYYDF